MGIGNEMEDKSQLFDFFIAEVTEADKIVHCGNRRMPWSIYEWEGLPEASEKAADSADVSGHVNWKLFDRLFFRPPRLDRYFRRRQFCPSSVRNERIGIAVSCCQICIPNILSIFDATLLAVSVTNQIAERDNGIETRNFPSSVKT
jgi:hypothetical protein